MIRRAQTWSCSHWQDVTRCAPLGSPQTRPSRVGAYLGDRTVLSQSLPAYHYEHSQRLSNCSMTAFASQWQHDRFMELQWDCLESSRRCRHASVGHSQLFHVLDMKPGGIWRPPRTEILRQSLRRFPWPSTTNSTPAKASPMES